MHSNKLPLSTNDQAITVTNIANLFNNSEIKIRQNMIFFVKVYRNLTSVLLCNHS